MDIVWNNAFDIDLLIANVPSLFLLVCQLTSLSGKPITSSPMLKFLWMPQLLLMIISGAEGVG
jgi:hypothetical protein